MSHIDELINKSSSINQSTHLFEYSSHSGWLQKNTHKFEIKIIKNNKKQSKMANS